MAIILTVRHIGALWDRTEPTPENLRKRQAAHLAKNPAAHAPTELSEEKFAYIGNGCWRVHCRCGERTHTDPEWRIACCFGCGAIWIHVTFPDEWQEIETLLAKRPVQGTRNWQPPETLEDLKLEQLAHGDPL